MKLFDKVGSRVGDFWANFYWDIGVDLGSSNIIVGLKDKGVIVDEPMMVARLKRRRFSGLSAPRMTGPKILAYGYKAKEMLNREPKQIEVVSPLKRGIISDLEATESLVAYYMRMISEIPSRYPKVFKPRIMVGVPGGVNDVQKRAIKTIFLNVGVKEVIMVEQAVLAAVGVGLPLERAAALLVVDIGGGKTEVSVVSLGGVVVGRSVESAGDDWDTAIGNYIKMKYGLLVGKRTAERIKIEVGNVSPRPIKSPKSTVIRGRDLETGLPKSVKVEEPEIREAISLEVVKVARAVGLVLDETPPELMDDILKRGIVVVGNGARLRGIEELIEEQVRINTSVAEEPGLCIMKGILDLMVNQDKRAVVKTILGRR